MARRTPNDHDRDRGLERKLRNVPTTPDATSEPDVSENLTSDDEGVQISLPAMCQAQAGLIQHLRSENAQLQDRLMMVQAILADKTAMIEELTKLISSPESPDEPSQQALP